MTLAEPDPFLNMLRQHGDVRHLFFGHVHLPVSGQWAGLTFSAIRGTCQHIELDLDNRDVAFAEGSPAYGVIVLHQRSEEHTSELQSLMRISYAVICLNTKLYPIN